MRRSRTHYYTYRELWCAVTWTLNQGADIGIWFPLCGVLLLCVTLSIEGKLEGWLSHLSDTHKHSGNQWRSFFPSWLRQVWVIVPHLFLSWSRFGKEAEGEKLWILGKTIGIQATQHLLAKHCYGCILSFLFCFCFFLYLDEQFTSKTELDEEPEQHACEHHFQDAAEAPNSSIGSILNLKFPTRIIYLAFQRLENIWETICTILNYFFFRMYCSLVNSYGVTIALLVK